jgi:hypothetical protein
MLTLLLRERRAAIRKSEIGYRLLLSSRPLLSRDLAEARLQFSGAKKKSQKAGAAAFPQGSPSGGSVVAYGITS